ncbi:tetratricopeptide repeat protein [bacterium]|nr:tetratricopeptide repeat protein [candidate division CSSED10-310 bacterium]
MSGLSVNVWTTLLIVAVATAAFSSILTNEFVFDDFNSLVTNSTISSPPSIGKILSDAGTHTAKGSGFTYRPLRTLFFILQYQMFARNPVGYHAVSLILHIGVSLFLFYLLRNLFDIRTSFLVAVIFSCHPLQTEVLASVKSQDDLLAAVFGLMALLLYLKHPWIPKVKSVWFWCGLVFSCLAFLSKETSIVLPLIFILIGSRKNGIRKLIHSSHFRIFLTSLFILTACYLWLRSSAVTPPEGKVHWLLLTSLTYVPLYWKLIMWPSVLTVDYTFLAVINDISPAVVILLLLQITCVYVILISKRSAMQFGILWFYIWLLPSLNLTTKGFVVFAERFVYMALAGALLVLADLFFWLLSVLPEKWWQVSGICVTVIIIILLIGRSVLRSRDWKNNEVLFLSVLEHNPESEIFNNFLMTEQLKKTDSIPQENILSQTTEFVKVPESGNEKRQMVNHAIALINKGNYERAKLIYEQIIMSRYADTPDWFNYGMILINLKHYSKGEQALEVVLRKKPKYAPALRMLGRSAFETSNYRRATECFTNALASDSEHAPSWYYVILSSAYNGREDDARIWLEQAQENRIPLRSMLDENLDAWNRTGEVLKKMLQNYPY